MADQNGNGNGSFNLDAWGSRVNDAVQGAYRDAVREHKRWGHSMIFWDHEKKCIKEVPAEDLPDFPPEPDAPPARLLS